MTAVVMATSFLTEDGHEVDLTALSDDQFRQWHHSRNRRLYGKGACLCKGCCHRETAFPPSKARERTYVPPPHLAMATAMVEHIETYPDLKAFMNRTTRHHCPTCDRVLELFNEAAS